MDSREVRDLMEAYLDVYASEEEIDEATRMRKKLGKEGEIAIRKELAARSNAYNRSGSVDNTIAAAERGADRPYVKFKPNESDADRKKREEEQSITLRDLASSRRGSVRDNPRTKLRGYAAKVEGDDEILQSARGSARSAGILTPNERKQLNMGDEFQNWVEALLDEGYDLSNYTWDDMYEAYTELVEELTGDRLKRAQEKINNDPLAAMTPATFLKPKDPGQQFASPRRKGPGGGRIPPSMAPSRTAANVADITRGRERNISRSRRLPTEPKTTKMVKKDGKWVKEVFDIVLAHLVNEGYANDFDSARKIMVNMSEEWIHSIVEWL